MRSEELEQIETKIAFLERANTELSDVVFRQQQEIRLLRARLDGLAVRFDALQSEADVGSPLEERPPHY
jgi:SlyX protein